MDERFKQGGAARKSTARHALGEWTQKLGKRDALKILQKSERTRIQSLIPLKRQRMSVNAFAFFRGAAPVMAYDLSKMPNTGILCQICGDAHVQNLGAFAGADGRLVFDVNDFDETIRAPFEWDVKRMATSILLAGETNKLKESEKHAAAEAFLSSYIDLIHKLASMPFLDVARYEVHRLHTIDSIHSILNQAERASPQHLLDRLTEEKSGKRVFRADPPLLRSLKPAERRAVIASLMEYRKSLLPEREHLFSQFKPVDAAFKVVGTGSVGMHAYCVYLQGNGPSDPMFLQIKEEAPSCYAQYLPAPREKQQGRRAARGQRAMQLQSDPLLGWTRMEGRDYLVRQLNDHKAALDLTQIDAAALTEYAQVCGELLARGHARSGTPCDLAGYIGSGKSFSTAILDFAKAYAEQTVEDWKLILKHVPALVSVYPPATDGKRQKSRKK